MAIRELFILIFVLVVVVWPWTEIPAKAGYSGWWALLVSRAWHASGWPLPPLPAPAGCQTMLCSRQLTVEMSGGATLPMRRSSETPYAMA